MDINYKLVLLIEECSEIIHAATKCLRFGYEFEYPGYGNNKINLSKEIGELHAIIDKLDIEQETFNKSYSAKWNRVEEFTKYNGIDSIDMHK